MQGKRPVIAKLNKWSKTGDLTLGYKLYKQ